MSFALFPTGRSWLVGPATHAELPDLTPGDVVYGLRIRTGAIRTVTGCAPESADRHVDLDDVFGSRIARELRERIPLGPAAVSELLRRRWDDPRRSLLPDRAVVALSHPSTDRIGSLATEFALSPRHFRRLVEQETGLSPKTIHRVSRLHRFLRETEREGRSLAQAAALAGYADQSHLGRDTRALTGLAPAALLTERSRR